MAAVSVTGRTTRARVLSVECVWSVPGTAHFRVPAVGQGGPGPPRGNQNDRTRPLGDY